MNATQLLSKLRRFGGDITLEGEELKVHGPRQILSPMVDAIVSHREELTEHLRSYRGLFEERAAIMEFDGGFNRREAETRAFDIFNRFSDN